MRRSPACLRKGTGGGGGAAVGVINKGPWTEAEDDILSAYIKARGEGNWRLIPKLAGLSRCGKSCRLRWINYLRPDLKRGNFSYDEDNLILTLHALLGNKWSLIAARIPGRTDNEIKNYWNTHLKRKLRSMGVDPFNYKVGLTLVPNKSDQLEDHSIQLKRPTVSSPSFSNHHNTTTHGSSAQRVKTNNPLLQADHKRLVSSPETSSSTGYGSRSSSSEFDSSCISQGEGVLPCPAPPPDSSTSSSVGKRLVGLEQLCPESEESVLYSEQPFNVLCSLERFPLHSPLHNPAAENFHFLPGSTWGWDYDHSMDSQMQLLDHAAATLSLEHFDCFESGILPLESQLQNDVQASTPWAPLCSFDSVSKLGIEM